MSAHTPAEYLRARLIEAGCSPVDADRVLSQVLAQPDDLDGRRLIACLALELRAEAIEVADLVQAVRDTAAEAVPDRAALGRHLCASADRDFATCVHPASTRDWAGERYVTVMQIQKYVYLFHGDSIGPGGIAKQIDFLQMSGEKGVEQDVLVYPMRGRLRPITWVTRAEIADEEIRVAAGDRAAAAAELVEKLGLPWDYGSSHHVVALYYPTDHPAEAPIGQPNSRCETWDEPGIFVAAYTDEGWGRTCGRCKSDHSGYPERVHGPLPPGERQEPFRAVYLSSVTLPPLDKHVALRTAEARWNAVAPPE